MKQQRRCVVVVVLMVMTVTLACGGGGGQGGNGTATPAPGETPAPTPTPCADGYVWVFDHCARGDNPLVWDGSLADNLLGAVDGSPIDGE